MKLWILLIWVIAHSAIGASKTQKRSYFLHISQDYLFTNSNADSVANASYQRKYQNPTVTSLGLGTVFLKYVYVGVRYEYWWAGRKMTVLGVETTDTLHYQTISAELGFYSTSPRVYLNACLGVSFPLMVKVDSKGAQSLTYENGAKPHGYEARAMLGIHFSSFHSFYLESGYRYTNLGKLKSGNIDYIGGSSLDLSGYFFGGGLRFDF